MFLCKLLVFSFVLNSAFGFFNISDSRITPERIIKFIKEANKDGENEGINAETVSNYSSNIIELMDHGLNYQDGEEVLRLISLYTVGISENSRDIITYTNLKQMWNVYEEIITLGKPKFIEHRCNVTSMKSRFQWEDEHVDFFGNLRKDALKAFNCFVEVFYKIKKQLKY
uniref:Uncharacterized protein n=1 Tax=Graphocephala atropunctata TaxID=36148 RepID=A0A1B6MB58_9HEMI